MATSQLTMLVRNFSTSGVASQVLKTPLPLFGLEGRYATALYSAATKMKQLDAVEKDLIKFQAAMKADPKLREYIKDPTYKRKAKAEALKLLGSQVPFQSATTNVLVLMAENGRMKKVDNVINAFKLVMAAHRGEVACEVTTAKEMDATQRKQVEDTLKKFVKGKEVILLTTKVDPDIIGGMIVKIGDKFVDMSISSKIKKYTELISTPV